MFSPLQRASMPLAGDFESPAEPDVETSLKQHKSLVKLIVAVRVKLLYT